MTKTVRTVGHKHWELEDFDYKDVNLKIKPNRKKVQSKKIKVKKQRDEGLERNF
jgi:hypothetical protein